MAHAFIAHGLHHLDILAISTEWYSLVRVWDPKVVASCIGPRITGRLPKGRHLASSRLLSCYDIVCMAFTLNSPGLRCTEQGA